MRTDGRTDKHGEARSRFLQFCEHALKRADSLKAVYMICRPTSYNGQHQIGYNFSSRVTHSAFEMGLLSVCNVKANLSLALITHHDVNEYGKVQV